MIRNQITLILGAGASSEYGFPLGKGLIENILCEMEHPKPNGIYKILADLGHTDSKEIGEFVTNLRGSNLDSIDEFLAKQPRFSALAKLCIAITLIPFENSDIVRKNGWYRYLVNRLFQGIDKSQFRHNKLSVITFNYDRSLEFYLRHSFRYTYDTDESEAERTLDLMDLVHVYGKLARLGGSGSDSRVYDPSLEPVFVKRAAEQVVTVPELQRRDTDYITDTLKRSERVCFLGFGYSNLNLRILRLNEFKIPQVMGTCVGLGDAEKKAISAEWGIEFPGNSKAILDFLKDFVPLT